jgi:rod shape determining protein RodA
MVKPAIPHLWSKRVPWSICTIAGVLVLLGWAGLGRYADLTGGGDHFLRQQMVWSLVAVGAMLAAILPNYRVLSRWSYGLLVLALLLLALAYLFPPINGARRWVRLGPVGFQPSEFVKIAFVLALARYLSDREPHRRPVGVLLPLVMALVPVLLILRQPNLGTAVLFVPVLFGTLFAAGVRRGDLAWLALLGLSSLPLLWTQMSGEQKSRVTAMFSQPGPGEAAHAETYQLRQAKQMMALGGAWGSLWTGQIVENPTAYHLPEAQSDFIFCVLVERLGLVGGGVVLGLYGVLVWRGLAIAAATREPFGRLVAAGLTAMLAVQVLASAGMTVGLLPVVGLSLPLVSYGGSGLVTQGLLIGLLVNVAVRPGYEVAGEPFRYVARPAAKTRVPLLRQKQCP